MNTRLLSHPLLIVPGLGGSGPGHWQAHWSERFEGAQQVVQENWDHPNLCAWLARLRDAVDKAPDAILIGHSLGCILIAHLAQADPHAHVAGAFLVAPADVERCTGLPDCLEAFGPVPRARLPFPSMTVASTNDPYMEIGRAEAFARSWGSQFRNVGEHGHINIAAGFGPWLEGEQILSELFRLIDANGSATAAKSFPHQKSSNEFPLTR